MIGYSCQKMFSLINDIEAYPEYMAGCVGAEVLAREDDWLEARLDLSKAGFKHSFVTRNTLVPPSSMSMELVSGPFNQLIGSWRFLALSGSACKVLFSLEYEFSNKILGAMMNRVFEKVAGEQVQCLCDRAKQIYSQVN